MLNLELDIIDTVEYSGSMLCVEQLKGSENSLFLCGNARPAASVRSSGFLCNMYNFEVFDCESLCKITMKKVLKLQNQCLTFA